MTALTLSRVDTAALFAALDEERRQRGLSWREVAVQMGYPAITEGMLRQTAKGGLIGIVQFMAYADWLGVPAERFVVRPAGWTASDDMEKLVHLLQAQKELTPEQVERLESAIRGVWEKSARRSS